MQITFRRKEQDVAIAAIDAVLVAEKINTPTEAEMEALRKEVEKGARKLVLHFNDRGVNVKAGKRVFRFEHFCVEAYDIVLYSGGVKLTPNSVLVKMPPDSSSEEISETIANAVTEITGRATVSCKWRHVK